jgi:hypothetical protein
VIDDEKVLKCQAKHSEGCEGLHKLNAFDDLSELFLCTDTWNTRQYNTKYEITIRQKRQRSDHGHVCHSLIKLILICRNHGRGQ